MLCRHSHILLYIRAPVLAPSSLRELSPSCDSHYLCPPFVSSICVLHLCPHLCPHLCFPICDLPPHPHCLTADCGIQRRHTMRKEPHSNGVAEKANGIIFNRATSLLTESKLPPSFWARAVAAVSYTHNRMPTSALHNCVPNTAFYGTKPDVSLLRVFGSTAYVHIKKDKRHGLSPHMEKLIFVGYPAQYKGWEFYNPVTRRFVLSDRADFDERDCPGTADFKADQIVFAPSTLPAPGLQDLDAPEVPDQVGDMLHLVGVNQPPPGTPSDSSASNNTPAPHSPSYSPTPASSHSNSSSSSSNLP